MGRFFRSLGFTITAVACAGPGSGATAAIFSIVYTVLLKPLTVFDSDHFVMLMNTWITEKGENESYPDVSPAEFEHWREHALDKTQG